MFEAEDRHFWFGARNLALKTVIQSLAPRLPQRCRLLEVGCGTGNTLRMMQEACPDAGLIVGMDLFAEGLRYARRRTAVPLVQGRVEEAPFNVPFDLVGLFDVLEHIQDDAASLEQIRTLMRPGGYLLLTVPAHKALWSPFDEEVHHCRRYEPEELRERLVAARLEVDYLTPFMAVLYPLVRVARWASGRANDVRRVLSLPEKSSVRADFAVRPGINELVGWVLRRETAALRRRQQISMGTSLLALAHVP